MNYKFWAIGGAALLLAGSIFAEAPDVPHEDDVSVDGTVITSHSLQYDQTARRAVFDRDVVVTDPQLRIMADRLTVFFSEDNQVKMLEAEGDVRISQRDLSATGSHAEYDVTEGRVVLSGNPRVLRGRDMLQGEKITFWRDSSRILSEPNARLVLYSDRDILTGATSVSDK